MFEFEKACKEMNFPLSVNELSVPKRNGGVEHRNKTFRDGFYENHDFLLYILQSIRSALQLAVKKYNDHMVNFALGGLAFLTYIQAIQSHSL